METPENTTNLYDNIDTDIENYTVMDIFEILNLSDPNIFNVKDKANDIIARMEEEGNDDLKIFFEQARDKALDALEGTNEYIDEIQYIKNKANNIIEQLENTDLKESFKIESDKALNALVSPIQNIRYIDDELTNIPNIIDKIGGDIIKSNEYSEEYTEINDFFRYIQEKTTETLEQTNEYTNEDVNTINDNWTNGKSKPQETATVDYYTSISQNIAERPLQPLGDTVRGEPIISRHIINIDSQYRTTILPYVDNPQSASFNTNFTFSLSNPITKAVSIRLYSYQIPTSWYAFNARAGNTFFLYNGIIINIPDGNYTPQEMVATINNIASRNISTEKLEVSYDSTSRKIKFTNRDTLSDYITVTFYIQNNVVNFNNCGNFILSNFQTLGINTTLGWFLGFHNEPDDVTGNVSIDIYPGDDNSIKASSPIDIYGPKYFILSLEDYTARLSSGLYNITNTKNSASVSKSDFYQTVKFECKTREGSLTRAQQYTINAIKESSITNNNVIGYSNQLSGPTSGSAFAIVPLIGITNLRPEPYVKFGADLAIFKRDYASPIVLDRFTVRLTDDKGNLVNLNDNDWSFSLIVEEQLN